jgi:glucose-6-phosphate isomerase
MSIELDYTNLLPFVTEEEIYRQAPYVAAAVDALKSGKGPGNDFLGWLKLPEQITDAELREISGLAEEFRHKCDAFTAIGIGGSYLGGRAVAEALFGTNLSSKAGHRPAVYFAGHHLSARGLNRLLKELEGKDVCLNVISKSGTTTEPGIVFRLLRTLMEKRYGGEASSRIVATTDREKGALRRLAEQEGNRTFVIPDDVGGRFSVLTPVGLFPLAVAGVDIFRFVDGFRLAQKELLGNDKLMKNPALFYATVRNILYRKGKNTELLANFEPDLHGISEWWKQLFGESEGKEGKGIFPAAVDFTTDLHSLGQYIQEGQRNIFETFLLVNETDGGITIPETADGFDGLNYLSGIDVTEVNAKAYAGTALAHRDGGIPNMAISIRRIDEFSLGELFYFFEFSVAVSGYLLGVNPFDQPGVEAYKKNMFGLLNKPGYEKLFDQLNSRLQNEERKVIV